MFKDKVLAIYKQNLFNRCDDNGCVFYFSVKDFNELKSKTFNFKSSKNDILKGSFYYYDNFKPNRLIIFDHGMGAGHLAYFKEIELLARNGFLVYSYDHTGCMNSEGSSTNGFAQSLSDLNDCVNTIKSLDELNNCEISVVGHSWGAFSTMNIVKFHKDIKSIVAMSGFISVEAVLKQTFKGFLKGIFNDAFEIEKQANPNYINCNAVDSLNDYPGKALIIHSKDDKVVNKKYHFDVLQSKLENKENISFLLVNNKNHNPNYTIAAVKYKDAFFKKYKTALKKNKLITEEAKTAFINQFDWNKMTAQDMSIWSQILDVLNGE